jgi:radical SAM protein with 4Fe4S-binding SPASM domain
MPTEEALRLLDEIAEAGCLFLVLTGGEPLLRSDFATIYRYAKEKGFMITVFSNATLIDETVLDLFRELPPHAVDISLYAATAETYERITGAKRSFQRCMDGIARLRDAGIRYRMKTVLMTLNQHEFADMEAIAERNEVPFRVDCAINPRLDGDRSPLGLRVAPEQAVELELVSEARHASWNEWHEKSIPLASQGKLYNCGGGVSGFHIDAYGWLLPCVIGTAFKYDLRTGPFDKGWDRMGSWIAKKTVPEDHKCNHCDKRLFCTWCPAFSELENVDASAPCEYLCLLAAARKNRIVDNNAGSEVAKGAVT